MVKGGAITTLASYTVNIRTKEGGLAFGSGGAFNSIALDATYVYWTDQGTMTGTGAVYRVAKN